MRRAKATIKGEWRLYRDLPAFYVFLFALYALWSGGE